MVQTWSNLKSRFIFIKRLPRQPHQEYNMYVLVILDKLSEDWKRKEIYLDRRPQKNVYSVSRAAAPTIDS